MMTQQSYDNMLKLITASAIAAQPIIGNLPDTLKTDPETTDPETLAQQSFGFRVTRGFANFIASTLENPAYWPKLPEIAGASVGGTPVVGAPAATLDPSAVAAALQASLGTPAGNALMAAVQARLMGGGAPAPAVAP